MQVSSGFSAELGRQQFMELLVTQLQYQDPLEPVGQQEFIQQLAQFSVVEGVENLNGQFEDYLKLQSLTDGADLVGRDVEYESPLTGAIQRGHVDEVRVVNGTLAATIDGNQVPVGKVIALFDSAAESATE